MIEVFLVISVILLAISVYFNVQFGLLILRIEDAIEESLDNLDERYKVFSKILEKPVFFDSIEIRQVVQEIKSCQELLLIIANRLAQVGDVNEEKK